MGLLAEAWNPRPRVQATSPDALHNFWYTTDPSGFVLEAGSVAMTAETLLRCGTVLAAVGFRGDSWAMCPPSTFQRTANGRKEEPDHYSQLVLRNPNRWQTGNRWRHLNGVWMALWGNAYNEMRGGRRSFAEELWPLHPTVCRPVDQRSDGSLIYLYQPAGQEERRLGQEKVLHFRDLSTDGIQGVPMHRLIRNVVGIALLAEKHQTTFLSKGSRISGLLVPSTPLTPDQRKVLRESVNEDLGGSQNTGTFGIMPHGVDVKPITSTHREAQFMELSDHVVGAILRFLRVPGFVVGYQGDKANTYASAKETAQEALRHTVLPIITNIEAEEEKALLLPGDGRQIKHNMDVLLRVNTKDRYDALAKAAGGPWISVNEARAIEDLNADPDPRHDKILTPSNMMPELLQPEPAPEPEPPPFQPQDEPDDEDDTSAVRARAARAQWLAQSAAAQVVRREIAAVTDKAPRYARDPDGWQEWVRGYYERHAGHVVRALNVPKDAAREYCDEQAAALLAGGAKVAEAWEAERVPRLTALALGHAEPPSLMED